MDRSNLGVKYWSGLSATIKSKSTGFGIGIRYLQDDESITHSDLRLSYKIWAAVHISKVLHLHRIFKWISKALEIRFSCMTPENWWLQLVNSVSALGLFFQGEIIISKQICGTEWFLWYHATPQRWKGRSSLLFQQMKGARFLFFLQPHSHALSVLPSPLLFS